MLVSRQCDSEHNNWSFPKFETTYHKSTSSPRMSNHFETPLSTQPDWQGQYSYLPPTENSIFSQPYEHGNDHVEAAQPRSAGSATASLEIAVKNEHPSPLEPLRRSFDPLGLRQAKLPSPITESSEAQPDQYAPKPSEGSQDDPLARPDSALPMNANTLPPAATVAHPSDTKPSHTGQVQADSVGQGEEEEELLDDEDMVEGGGTTSQPQTAAERTAQRRKMKRFRLTHQQTRFLMSEFAKQPHPDAAHRERLSREIPGLSPRQVQVWFQNRRAKIKRLTADDRERMIKMRAVPDDFDNVSALHSPYGAVHGLGTPIASPVDFGTPSYADHMIRPLMVDVRRAEGEDHISPTGLSPAFGNIGFTPTGNMSNPDIISPLSPTSNDRYYSSHMTTSLSAGPRTSNPYGRQNGMDSSMQGQTRQGVRALQPLQLRETMSRSRSDNLQSPLRSSMSWKGDTLDYSTYPGSGSPQIGGRNQSVYQPEQIGASSAPGLGYDSGSYSSNPVQSPTAMNYPSIQPSQPSRNSRLRAASANLPLGLDIRNQYRSANTIQSPNQATTPRAPGSSSYNGATYSSSFPSAPLTAPMDFSMSRNTNTMRSGVQDYSMPQMSAPISQPNDFSQAFQASLSSPTSRTPMRDSFSGSSLHHEQRSDGYGDDISSNPLKRKASYASLAGNNPVSSGSTSHSIYGSTS